MRENKLEQLLTVALVIASFLFCIGNACELIWPEIDRPHSGT
jgi:hypothetical protein